MSIPYIIDEVYAHIQTVLDLPTAGITPTPDDKHGDFSLACFHLAKATNNSPQEFTTQRAHRQLPVDSYIESITADHGYLNITLNYARIAPTLISSILDSPSSYGSTVQDHPDHIVIDMSSPNIAKRMSIGHLRSTIIGDSLARIHTFLGHKVTKDNHIGDWGTQFGLLLFAVTSWGNMEAIANNPIPLLQDLYVRVNTEADADETIKDAGRAWFKKLEDGDPQARSLWKQIVVWSYEDFARVYDLLEVTFDTTLGESFYEPFLGDVISRAVELNLAKEDNGALLVDLEAYGLGKVILRRADGATLYITRELATGIYRSHTLLADRMIYVVGEDQTLYFAQYFKLLSLLGFSLADRSQHVSFGMTRLKDGKMSTRKGRVIYLEDVITQALERTKAKFYNEMSIPEHEKAALLKQLAIGSLKWNDLSTDPKKSIVFDWDRILSTEGDSAPYIQYTYARTISILQKAHDVPNPQLVAPTNDAEKKLLRAIALFPQSVKRAGDHNSPALIAQYVYDISRRYNAFYNQYPILNADNLQARNTRLCITSAVGIVIKNALTLLGIHAPERM